MLERAIPWSPAFRVLMALCAALAAFVAGAWVGVEWQIGKQARLDVKQRSAVIDALVSERDRERQINAGLQLKLDASMGKAMRQRQDFDRRLRDANSSGLVQCLPAPQQSAPRSDAVVPGDAPGGGPDVGDVAAFSLDFVGLYNDALCIGSDSPECAGRGDDAAFRSGFALPKDILANAAENAGRCAIDRARLRLWQEWARQRGLTP